MEENTMLTQTKELCNKATCLPPLERIELIESLFFSLDSEHERNAIDKLWAIEAEDRLKAYKQGKLKSVSARKVFEKIDKKKNETN